MKNKGLPSQISLTGQDGLDWSISQNFLLVNDWLPSHQFLTLHIGTWFTTRIFFLVGHRENFDINVPQFPPDFDINVPTLVPTDLRPNGDAN